MRIPGWFNTSSPFTFSSTFSGLAKLEFGAWRAALVEREEGWARGSLGRHTSGSRVPRGFQSVLCLLLTASKKGKVGPLHKNHWTQKKKKKNHWTPLPGPKMMKMCLWSGDAVQLCRCLAVGSTLSSAKTQHKQLHFPSCPNSSSTAPFSPPLQLLPSLISAPTTIVTPTQVMVWSGQLTSQVWRLLHGVFINKPRLCLTYSTAQPWDILTLRCGLNSIT